MSRLRVAIQTKPTWQEKHAKIVDKLFKVKEQIHGP